MTLHKSLSVRRTGFCNGKEIDGCKPRASIVSISIMAKCLQRGSGLKQKQTAQIKGIERHTVETVAGHINTRSMLGQNHLPGFLKIDQAG